MFEMKWNIIFYENVIFSLASLSNTRLNIARIHKLTNENIMQTEQLQFPSHLSIPFFSYVVFYKILFCLAIKKMKYCSQHKVFIGYSFFSIFFFLHIRIKQFKRFFNKFSIFVMDLRKTKIKLTFSLEDWTIVKRKGEREWHYGFRIHCNKI